MKQVITAAVTLFVGASALEVEDPDVAAPIQLVKDMFGEDYYKADLEERI